MFRQSGKRYSGAGSSQGHFKISDALFCRPGRRRCFLLGQAGDDLLIHCPDGTTPRNHTVKRSDAGITVLGVSEKIFDPPQKRSDERTQ